MEEAIAWLKSCDDAFKAKYPKESNDILLQKQKE